jgi:hypothetical protein
MNVVVIIPSVLIAVAAVDLLRHIVVEGRKRMQSKRRRDAVLRWVRDAQLSN